MPLSGTVVPDTSRYTGAVIAAIQHDEFLRMACVDPLLRG
jgi:hypothetical protein